MRLLFKLSPLFSESTIILIFILDPKNKHFLTKIEAIRLKKDIYINYKKDLVVKRSQEMEERKIKINNRQMKFDLKFMSKDFPLTDFISQDIE